MNSITINNNDDDDDDENAVSIKKNCGYKSTLYLHPIYTQKKTRTIGYTTQTLVNKCTTIDTTQ